MFKISHEVPTEMLEESRDFNDYDYALVHLFEENPDYFNFYKASLKAGRKVILDNSAFELGEPMENASYLYWIRQLRPTEVILPDYRNDRKKTVLAAQSWSDAIKITPTIGVVHGRDYEDYCKCYMELLPLVDKLSFSVEDFFTKFQKDGEDLADARKAILAKMVADKIIDESKPHHILGCLHPTEYRAYVDYKWIESADTSNPVVYGITEGKYPEFFQDYKKSSVKLAELLDINLETSMKSAIRYNIKWFRDQLSPKTFTHCTYLDIHDLYTKKKSEFSQITESIADLLEYKNEKYGNAVLDPLDIFKGKCKAGQRLDDKLSRVKNSSSLRKNDVADLIGYLVLTCKENGWTDFSEFKD